MIDFGVLLNKPSSCGAVDVDGSGVSVVGVTVVGVVVGALVVGFS